MATRGARPPAWRILVAGGGPPGLALALALVRDLGEAVSVSVLDPAFARTQTDGRAYALSAAAAGFLHRIGAWDGLATEPITAMTITDSRIGDAVRPDYLTFGDGLGALGYMVEAADLQDALAGACRSAGIALEAVGADGFSADSFGLDVATSDGGSRRVALLVAGDGGRSRLRELAGIGFVGRRYRQAGLVATIAHERPHCGRAVQHFLPAGPFALLPLPDRDGLHRSSIVWTEDERLARTLLGLPEPEIVAAVEQRSGPELGAVRLLTPLSAHPLALGLARAYRAERLALIGDAAHQIHPLAGQGLNLGLADAEALAHRVGEAVRLGLDPGAAPVLRAYERDRRADAVALAAATDGLNRLFSNDVLPVRVLRDIGLGLVDRAPGLKGFLQRRAAGVAQELR